MEGRKTRSRHSPIWIAIPLIAFCASSLRAEMVHVDSPVLEMIPPSRPIKTIDANQMVRSVQQEWQAFREGLNRAAVETMATMFFIRGAPPPPTPTPPTPPGQGGGVTPPPPPPPPPSGSGEPGPTDPPPVDPPQGTPEPASLVIAMLGAGVTSWYGWKRRSRKVVS